MKLNYFILIFIVGVTGCSIRKDNHSSAPEITSYYHSDGFDYRVKFNIENDNRKTNKDELEKILVSIQLSIKQNEVNNLNMVDYESYLKFYSFKLGDYIKLINGLDTISNSMYLGERNYDNSPISHAYINFIVDKNVWNREPKPFLLVMKNEFINKENIQFEISSTPSRKVL
jgi:hypothetical protein